MEENKTKNIGWLSVCKKFEDDEFLKAVDECMAEATCTAAEVAEKVGCNSILAKIGYYNWLTKVNYVRN